MRMMTKTINIQKRLLLLAVFVIWVAGSFSAPISYEQALTKAKSFLTARNKSYRLALVQDATAKARTATDSTDLLLYVFNICDSNGFVILSVDDRTPSILGYSDKGRFDYNQLPDNARAWLDSYASQIASLTEGQAKVPSRSPIYPVIEPMLSSIWNQTTPYNDSCPVFFTNRRSVTGCVATAMAQVLFYHRAASVSELQAGIPAYDCNSNYTGYGRIHVDAIPQGAPLDWANMIDDYSGAATAEQKKAVADLMHYCGAAVEMDYRDQYKGSSANGWSIAGAMGKYFGYSADVATKDRSRFTDESWTNLIYRELKNGRPVIFSGSDNSSGMGHAFVCDGYDGNGFFHFNWGWGGVADGHYLMSDLRPEDQGVGGWGDAYNDDVVAIVGLHPDDGTNPFVEKPCLTITQIEKPILEVQERKSSAYPVVQTIIMHIRNCTSSTQGFDTAIGWYKDGVRIGIKETVSKNEFGLNTLLTLRIFPTFGANLELGTYQIKALSRLIGADEWLENNGSDKLYIEAVVEEKQITFNAVMQEETIELDENGIEKEKPAPLVTFTAKNYTREYGEGNPVLGYSISGGAVEGKPDVSCSATPQSPVGVYPIVISKGGAHYDNCEFVNGTLTITKAPLTIKVGNYTRKQGEENPEFTIEYEGFKNGETADVLTKQPVVTTEAVKETAPGKYAITVSEAEAGNYEISYVMGELTVTEADPIMLTARSYTREYGEENPAFEFTSEGAALDGEPAFVCDATATSAVGTYDISISKGTVKNYNDTYINGTLTITKAPLTVKVKDMEREQGEENPQFELLYEGWKLQDTEQVLLKKPVVTTTATKDSPVGEYVIMVSGGEAENYELFYEVGKLTITIPSSLARLMASGRPFDVYDLRGRKVHHQVTTLKGLSRGIYLVQGMCIVIR